MLRNRLCEGNGGSPWFMLFELFCLANIFIKLILSHKCESLGTGLGERLSNCCCFQATTVYAQLGQIKTETIASLQGGNMLKYYGKVVCWSLWHSTEVLVHRCSWMGSTGVFGPNNALTSFQVSKVECKSPWDPRLPVYVMVSDLLAILVYYLQSFS